MGIHAEGLDAAARLGNDPDFEWPPGALEPLEPGEGYGDRVDRLGLGLDGGTLEILNETPPMVADTIITAFRSARTHGLKLRTAWMPGVAYEATVAQVDDVVTLLVRSPAPGRRPDAFE